MGEFARSDCDAEFYLYAHGEIEVPEACLIDARFKIRIRHFRPSLVWMHTVAPYLMKKDRIDVFWGTNYAAPLYKLTPHKTVLTIHDTTFARYPETMGLLSRLHNRWLLPVYVRRADAILTVSQFSKSEIMKVFGLGPDKVAVTHLAPKEFPPTDECGEYKQPYILTVGTVEPRKNYERLIKAYSTLPASLRDAFHLLIVGGPGWGDCNLKRWFAQYGVLNSATYLGAVSDERLARLYRGATAFAYPSLYEGFGLPILEAMRVGVPVICSHVSGMREAAGNAALYFDPMDVRDIAFKLEVLLQDKQLRQHLSAKGIEHAMKFAWEETARYTFSRLSEVVSIC
ncbi:MAG: glycosyltransferase family 4 protein [Alicyclobacillus sp.]|nr:glycosyltransferase family 4 protein [Alicyclobacillus sp.]